MNPSIDLEAAKAAFFASGGQLVVLEGFTYQPLPQRKHPAVKRKPTSATRSKKQSPLVSRAKTRAAKIAEMAKTMTCGEVAELLGETKGALWGVAAREGFRFQKPAKEAKPVRSTADQEKEDRELAERIVALRDTGASRCRVASELGIGNRKLQRILATFEIRFPLQRHRG